MKRISLQELTFMLNREGGIPKGEEAQFSAHIRGFGNKDDLEKSLFFAYEGLAQLISKGNRNYVIRCEDVNLNFTQREEIYSSTTLGNIPYIAIPISISNNAIIILDKPEQIKF